MSLGPDEYQDYFNLSEWLVTSSLSCNNLEGCRDFLGHLYPPFGIDFGMFKDLIGRVPWNTALEGGGVQESQIDEQGNPDET